MTIAPRYTKPSPFPISCIRFHYSLLGTPKRLKFIWLIGITVAAGIAGLIAPMDWLWGLSLLAFCSAIYDIYSQYVAKKHLAVRTAFELPRLMGAIRPSIREEQAGYVAVRVPDRGDAVLISEPVNSYLRTHAGDITLKWDAERREEIISRLRPEADFLKDVLVWRYNSARNSDSDGAMFGNDLKIGLGDTITPGVTQLTLFQTSYYLSFVTNDLCTFDVEDISNRAYPQSRWLCVDHFPVDDRERSAQPRIKSLEASMLSNHIGGNTIAFTRDRRLVLRRQARAMRSVGLLAPTGSGSLDYRDCRSERHTLGQLVIAGMTRELLEENHAPGQTIIDWAGDTRIIGFFRWLGKGGLPGFLGITRVSVDSHHLQPNTSEVDSPSKHSLDWPAESATELHDSICQLLESPFLSVPLFANLHVLKVLLEAEPQFVRHLWAD